MKKTLGAGACQKWTGSAILDTSKELIKKVRNAKRNQEKKLANSDNNNSRRLVAYIKSKTVDSIRPLKHEDASLITKDIDIAESIFCECIHTGRDRYGN